MISERLGLNAKGSSERTFKSLCWAGAGTPSFDSETSLSGTASPSIPYQPQSLREAPVSADDPSSVAPDHLAFGNPRTHRLRDGGSAHRRGNVRRRRGHFLTDPPLVETQSIGMSVATPATCQVVRANLALWVNDLILRVANPSAFRAWPASVATRDPAHAKPPRCPRHNQENLAESKVM